MASEDSPDWRETIFELELERGAQGPFHRTLLVTDEEHPYNGRDLVVEVRVSGDAVHAVCAIGLQDPADVRRLHAALGAYLNRCEPER